MRVPFRVSFIRVSYHVGGQKRELRGLPSYIHEDSQFRARVAQVIRTRKTFRIRDLLAHYRPKPRSPGKGLRTSKVALIYYPLVKMKPILSVYFFAAALRSGCYNMISLGTLWGRGFRDSWARGFRVLGTVFRDCFS